MSVHILRVNQIITRSLTTKWMSILFDRKPNTIREWIKTDWFPKIGYSKDGRPLYFDEHVQATAKHILDSKLIPRQEKRALKHKILLIRILKGEIEAADELFNCNQINDEVFHRLNQYFIAVIVGSSVYNKLLPVIQKNRRQIGKAA